MPNSKLVLYPNPASDFLHIFPSSPPSERTSFRIFNNEGKLVKDLVLAQSPAEFLLPIRELAAGVYFLQYLEQGEVTSVERFVVQQ